MSANRTDLASVVAVVIVEDVGDLQHTGVDISSALVDGCVNLVVTVGSRRQVCRVGAKVPLELWARVGLHSAHDLRHLPQVVRHLVRSVYNNRLIWKHKVTV